MNMRGKLAYNKKGTFNNRMLDVAKLIWFPPKSMLELGGFLLY